MQSPQLNSGDQQNEIGGFLGWIEKSGNKLPDRFSFSLVDSGAGRNLCRCQSYWTVCGASHRD